MALFSPDSKFMQFMTRVGDLILLNFFFLITCIPIVTIGDAITSMYDVCFRLGTEREPMHGTTRAYFEAFKANFKPATLVWLVLLGLGAATGFNTLAFYALPGGIRYFFMLFALLFLLVLFMAAYAFPLVSQFENRTMPTLKNALVLSLAYLPRTILMVALNILPFVLLLCNVIVFFQAGLMWLLIYFGAAAYINTRLLRKVFAPYLEEEETSAAADEAAEEEDTEEQPALKEAKEDEPSEAPAKEDGEEKTDPAGDQKEDQP